MDRAYDTNTLKGTPIRKDHPKYQERVNHKKIFEDGMNTLLQYFKSINAEKGVTWFVNECSFRTTEKFPTILKKCIDSGGEIGLHTHFNSSLFKSSVYTMPENPNIWEKEGIIESKKRLEEFMTNNNAIQKKVNVFKAGNHIRNKAMFEKLVEHGFEIDTTCQIGHIEIRKVDDKYITLFDDTNIKAEPFIYKTNNGELFEIPELGSIHPRIIEKYIKTNKENDLYIRIQLHPWQAINDDIEINRSNQLDSRKTNLLEVINYCLSYIKNLNIPFEYLNCNDMRNNFLLNNTPQYNTINCCIPKYTNNEFEKTFTPSQEMDAIYINNLLTNFENKISNTYQNIFNNDTSSHYKTMITQNRIFGKNDLFIINYIYNNFNKNISCLDLFAGIGQSVMGLHLLGFTTLGLLEFDKYRTDLASTICNEENLNIKIISDDFYKNEEIFDYEVLFTNNAVNSTLGHNIDKQLEIYIKFLESTKNKNIILNPEKYGVSEDKKTNIVCYKLITEFKKNGYIVNNIGNNFVRISNYKLKNIYTDKFSNYFTNNYNTINNNNIITSLVVEKDNKLFTDLKSIEIKIGYKEKHPSFGIYFDFNKNKLLNEGTYKLIFYAKSTAQFQLKIYTGTKWINIDTILTTIYQKIEIETFFNFQTKSTYRIGVQNINEINNELIYILNPIII